MRMHTAAGCKHTAADACTQRRMHAYSSGCMRIAAGPCVQRPRPMPRPRPSPRPGPVPMPFLRFLYFSNFDGFESMSLSIFAFGTGRTMCQN